MATATLSAPPAAPTMTTTGDMLSSVPADVLTSLSDAPTEPGPVDESLVDDAPPAGDDEPITVMADEPVKEPEPEDKPLVADAEDDKPPVEDKPVDDKDEDLPEGVSKGKDKKGKPGYFLEENRYKSVYGNHKLTQDAAEIIGEPLTADAITLRHQAFLGQERLFNNLTSGDPAAQSDVVRFMLKEMKTAQDSGAVGVDPTVPFAESMYSALRDQSPDGYAKMRLMAARDLLAEMYEDAASTGNENLFSAAQRFSATLVGLGQKPEAMTPEDYAAKIRKAATDAGLPFYATDEMKGVAKREDPNTRLQRENTELKAKLEGRTSTGTAAQFDVWKRANVKEVNESILTDIVKPALTSVETEWKNFPDDYRRLVTDPLHREVAQAVKADTGLNDRIVDLQAQAKRAASEQVRERIGGQIKSLILNRARLAAEKAKGPILKFAAESLKGRSDVTHARRNGAQTRTVPQGQSAPVSRSVLPSDLGFKNGQFDAATAVKQAARLMGA